VGELHGFRDGRRCCCARGQGFRARSSVSVRTARYDDERRGRVGEREGAREEESSAVRGRRDLSQFIEGEERERRPASSSTINGIHQRRD
jgi:hypothetical protein